MLQFFGKINNIARGFRTFLAAFAIAVEPVLERALLGSVDLDTVLRQSLIAAVVVALRFVTKTPAGRRS